MMVIKQIYVIYIIDCFDTENPGGKYPWTKKNVFLSFVFFPRPNYQDKICHMVTRKHTKVIEGRRLFNSTGVHEPDETAKDGVIDNYGCD